MPDNITEQNVAFRSTDNHVPELTPTYHETMTCPAARLNMSCS